MKLTVPTVPGKVTLVVKVDTRELQVRVAVGLWLINLGARIIGLGLKVEPPEGSSDGA